MTTAIDPVLTLAEVSALLHAASEAKRHMAEFEQQRDADIARVRDAFERDTETYRKTIAYAEATAEQFMRRRLKDAHEKDRKSVPLPWGEIRSREQQPELTRDEPVLRAWAEEHGYMRTPKAPEPVVDWERIKKEAQAFPASGVLALPDGTVVEGVTVTERDPSVTVVIN